MAQQATDELLEALVTDLDRGFASFVRANADPVHTAALRLVVSPADAQDVAQEAFIRAYRSLRDWPPERIRALRPRAWLVTIVLNLWRNRLRDAARRPALTPLDGQMDPADVSLGPEPAAVAAEGDAQLAAMLAALPEHHRVPVILRHVVGLSYKELSEVLGCPAGTAKAQVSRGLTQLRELLDASAKEASS